MSQQLKTPDKQVNAESQQSATQQKKIDPVTQLNRVNNQQVDGGWGIFSNLPAGRQGEQPVQKFAKEEEEELQMKPENSLSSDIDNAIQARFGTQVIQKQTE
jgi:hypothetical protein